MKKLILFGALIITLMSFNGPKRLTFASCSPTSGAAVVAEGQLMLAEIRRFSYASNIEFYHESGGLYFCYRITYWL